LVVASWKHDWVIGPTEKLQNACPSAELGDCGGCLCCCCRMRCSSPSIRACLPCLSFSSMSKGQMVHTAPQNVVHVSCELFMRALSVGGSCHLHPTTRRLLLLDIEKTGAHGKGGACDTWTEQVREPHLNNTHTHTLKTLTHFHPLYVRGASSSGFSRY